mgnify:CR=1 FL=1
MNKVRKVLTILLCMAMVVGINLVDASTGIEVARGDKVSNAYDPNYNGGTMTGVTDLADRIWATAILIVQVVSVGCVVFAGLRYMYASADKKADIKKGMMYLAIGAIFVYATSTVMKFVFNIGSDLIK